MTHLSNCIVITTIHFTIILFVQGYNNRIECKPTGAHRTGRALNDYNYGSIINIQTNNNILLTADAPDIVLYQILVFLIQYSCITNLILRHMHQSYY